MARVRIEIQTVEPCCRAIAGHVSLTEQQRDGACADRDVVPQVRGGVYAAHDASHHPLSHESPQCGTSQSDTSQIA